MAKKKPIQKDATSSHWKKLIHHKLCSFCDNVAVHYEKFKYYCDDCYQKLIKKGKK